MATASPPARVAAADRRPGDGRAPADAEEGARERPSGEPEAGQRTAGAGRDVEAGDEAAEAERDAGKLAPAQAADRARGLERPEAVARRVRRHPRSRCTARGRAAGARSPAVPAASPDRLVR